MAWKASCAHRTGENEKKDNDKIKKVGPNVERLWSNRFSIRKTEKQATTKTGSTKTKIFNNSVTLIKPHINFGIHVHTPV